MNKQIKSRGFTIVELLIVIVIIAILAAITMVAYNGITSRAHSSAAISAAQVVQQKAEAYNAEVGNYPLALGDMTDAASDKSYNLSASAATSGTPSPTNADNVIGYAPCPSGATTSTVTGVNITYYKYDGSDKGVKTLTVGKC